MAEILREVFTKKNLIVGTIGLTIAGVAFAYLNRREPDNNNQSPRPFNPTSPRIEFSSQDSTEQPVTHDIFKNCVQIGELPVGRQTPWTAVSTLSDNMGIDFDPESSEPVYVVHGEGNITVYPSIESFLQTNPVVYKSDTLCFGEPNK